MKKDNGYELIPELINHVNKYSDKIKDRVKIDGIFNEIDLYASNGFKKFIKLSDNRYKFIKSGISLNDLLERQKNEYKELSDDILENQFYMNNEIENESKKLYKKATIKESKQLYRIRRDIINKNKNLSPSEIIKRKKYIKKRTKNNLIQENNLSKEEPTTKEKNSLININKETEDNHKFKKKFLSEIVEMDKNFLNKNIEIYKDFLKDIEKTKDNSKILKIMSRNDNLGHKYSFKLNNIKLLSFKEAKKENIKKKKKEVDSKMDIKTLMKYTRRGNQKWFQDQLRQKSLKRLNSIKLNLKKNESSTTDNNSIVEINKYISDKNSNNKNIFNKTTFSNFGNTIKTVKNEAQFIKNIRENFDIKRKTVNKFFKTNSLPILEENGIKEPKDKNNKIISPINRKIEKSNLMHDIKKNNKNEEDEDTKIKNIFDTFKNTYYSKIRSWSQEENARKGIRKREKEINENMKKYLKEIKAVKRKAHLFVDIYSLRDGIVNERIKLFNRSLNGPIYSKNCMKDMIEDFNNYIEYKEKERILNEELLKQKQLEEAEKQKKEDLGYQTLQKMRKNLNLNNKVNKDEENIDFNYRYTSSIKNKNNNNKNREIAFRDYLESFQTVKEKAIDNK